MVVEQESRDLVEELRGRGREVDYLVFEDEGHGFQKKKNQIAAAEKYVAFLAAHLVAK